jgi:hypothetical protein
VKSLLGLLLIVAAPLAAQTSSSHTIVFKVVLTTVTSPSVEPPLTIDPGQPPVIVPDPPTDPPTSPSTDPSTNPGQGSTTDPPIGCGSYSDAVTAMNHVYANLIYTQQLYTAAQTAGPADASVYTANNNALVQMQLYSQDIRDIIRIGGSADIIGQGVAAISNSIAKLPALLSGKQELPLTPLVADMQAGLTNISKLIQAGSCSESVP